MVRYPSFILSLLFLFTIVGSGHAREIRVGIGFSIPPYVITEQDAGVEVDAIREAFKAVGHDAVFVYLPNLRLPVAFETGDVDCVASNAAYDIAKDSGRKAFPSDTTVVFRNFAISLTQNALAIPSVSSLENKRVLGFNNARKYLGSEFALMADSNPQYSELADQALQVRMLYSERVQVIISEKRIFLYWRKKLAESSLSQTIDLTSDITFSPIFSSAPRNVSFSTQKLRDQFDAGLATIKANGAFDAVVAKYTGVEQSE